jgi:hypothetical protein
MTYSISPDGPHVSKVMLPWLTGGVPVPVATGATAVRIKYTKELRSVQAGQAGAHREIPCDRPEQMGTVDRWSTTVRGTPETDLGDLGGTGATHSPRSGNEGS